MRRVLVLVAVVGACVDDGSGTELGEPADLTKGECDARARAARDACVAECSTSGPSSAEASTCRAHADRSLQASSGVLVGVGIAARSSIFVPFELCLGQSLVSSCADDVAKARTIAAGLGSGGAPLVDAWFGAGEGFDCATAKALVRAECVRERKLWAQVQAASSVPAEHDAGVQLAMTIGVYEVQAAGWITNRRDCRPDVQSCVDECPDGLGAMGWVDCRWECPVAVAGACTPPGESRACGVVDRSFAWDALYACECSADTAACRAPR